MPRARLTQAEKRERNRLKQAAFKARMRPNLVALRLDNTPSRPGDVPGTPRTPGAGPGTPGAGPGTPGAGPGTPSVGQATPGQGQAGIFSFDLGGPVGEGR